MPVAEIKQKIVPVLKKYDVTYAGVFGSVARGEDTPESDIDILVSVGKPIGVYQFIAMKEELERAVGKTVDLVSKKAVNRHLAPQIEKDLVTIYEG